MERLPNGNDAPLTRGGWAAIVVLIAFLCWAIWYAVRTWGSLSGVPISPAGWLWLSLGVLFTLVVGGGLMGLVFYSSRKNFDR
ncbi:MAG: hypothetical protein JOZ55_04565 [Alphaproteobacteria bacterium]|nr:hypothetical protein [Alphaproteobacteria bacterium]